MRIEITAEHESMVRALLVGDEARLAAVVRNSPSSRWAVASSTLTIMVLAELVRRRFPGQYSHADIVRYVARLRNALELGLEEFDPAVAEATLRWAIVDPERALPTSEQEGAVLAYLMPWLAHDVGVDAMSASELGALIDRARLRVESTDWNIDPETVSDSH